MGSWMFAVKVGMFIGIYKARVLVCKITKLTENLEIIKPQPEHSSEGVGCKL